MPVCVNFNICDNSPECSGIAACEFGAIYWDEEKESVLGGKGTLSTDNSKCVSCGKCVGEEGCPIGAIIFAKTAGELNKITNDLQIDVEQVKALFIERYGAEAVDESICIELNDLSNVVETKNGIVVVEEFTDDSIQCLLKSIPVSNILDAVRECTGERDIVFYKVYIENPNDSEYPGLKIFNKHICLGRVGGYYEDGQADTLIAEICKILKQDS